MRQERTAGGAVEHDVGIGVVVHDEQVVLTGERDDFVVQGVVTHRSHGVGGKRHDHVLGAVGNLGIDVGDIREEIVLGVERVIRELGVGDLGTRLEDGVTWIGHEDRVAGIQQRQAQVTDALLSAVARSDHVGRDSRDTKATLVVIANSLLELGQVA